MSMLAYRLMRLIEAHAETLAESLVVRVAHAERCEYYRQVPTDELKTRVAGVYAHLGQWLNNQTGPEIEEFCTSIGMRRAEQGVPISQMLWCIVMVKENLWDYLKQNELLENPSQIFGELELVRMIDQFFDSVMFHAVHGHETVQDAYLAELRR